MKRILAFFKSPLTCLLRFSLLFLIFFPSLLFSQDKIALDSLLVQLNHSERDSVMVKTLWNLSDYYWSDDLREAHTYSIQALDISNEIDCPRLIAISNLKVGDALLFLGNYSEALSNYLKSLAILEELKDKDKLFTLYHNMGALFDQMEEYDKALENYYKALYIHNNSTNKASAPGINKIHTLYNSIGNIYEVKGENETSLKYYNKALDLAQRLNDHQNLGTIFNNLGRRALKLNNLDQAYEYLQKSLEHRKEIDDLNGMAKSYNNLTKYYMLVGNAKDGQVSAENAIEFASAAGALPAKMSAVRNLSDILYSKGKYQRSLDAFKTYKDLSDSLINEASIKKQTELQIKYEYAKQEKIREAEQQKRDLRNGLIISVLSLGFIITGLLYSLAKNRSKRVQLEKRSLVQDLEMKNQDIVMKDKELAATVLYLLKKNELLGSISTRLLQLKKRMKPENHNLIQKIIFDLQGGASEDVWEEFEIRFKQVHNDYYKKLKEYASDLTPGEVKICTFLKLNMTSKEISAITHQSVKSIEVTRTRIRKKLNLTNKEVNLVTFLIDL